MYDNYSKLIKAVETIGKMRNSLEEEGAPMVMTKTLAPAVGFIAETASALIKDQENMAKIATEQRIEPKEEKNLEKQTVRWALDTPRRLRSLLEEGRSEDAERDWEEIKTLLSKWSGVKGVEELKQECEDIMNREK